METNDQIAKVRDELKVVQPMIDISADRLNGLRTQCATSVDLTRQEIRTLEGKLLKMFARQLVTKSKIRSTIIFTDIPSVRQWLQVVGLQTESINGICDKVDSIETLLKKSDHDLNQILKIHNANPNEIRKLHRALYNLKRYVDILQRGDNNVSDLELYWDSWERHKDLKISSSSSTRNKSLTILDHVADDDVTTNKNFNNNNFSRSSNESLQSPPMTPTTKKNDKLKYISTPPPRKKSQAIREIISLLPGSFPLTKSKSHESQLSGKSPENKDNLEIASSQTPRRGRLPTEPCLASNTELESSISSTTASPSPSQKQSPELVTSPLSIAHLTSSSTTSSIPPCFSSPSITSPTSTPTPTNLNRSSPINPLSPTISKTNKKYNLIYAQRLKDSSPLIIHSTNLSPIKTMLHDNDDKSSGMNQASGGGGERGGIHIRHEIAHRFTKMYKMIATCDYCDRQMIFVTGLKCRECKFKCHRECEVSVPPSCGLPSEYMDEFKRRMIPSDSELDNDMDGKSPVHQSNSYRKRKLSHPPTTAGSSRHGESGNAINGKSGSHPSSPAFGNRHSPGTNIHFSYPEVNPIIKALEHTKIELKHDKVVSASDSGGSGSMDSDKNTTRVDSQESQISDTEQVIDENIRNSQRWPRQNSQLSMREWDIPYDELKLGEQIGTGRFGTVFRGNWHGDVAIKLLNMDYLDDDKALEAFKSEVGTFRKTRHENLVLFMGACMKPPRLAIVTSLSKGMTLYTHIHLRKDKFNMNKTTIVAQQITQGMGYLHARGIVHKDLKSKNIFLENGKVVITDFGLFSVTKLCYGNGKANTLNIPPGWLCYLAPEIVRSLRINQVHHELPFSKASDLYAFGTVWYELLCGEWPFKGQPPESVIWQVGKGMKQPLANLQASRDVKDILMLCWTFRAENRPDFVELLNLLEKLPKKRLARSPSHPVHLSRSAESVF